MEGQSVESAEQLMAKHSCRSTEEREGEKKNRFNETEKRGGMKEQVNE